MIKMHNRVSLFKIKETAHQIYHLEINEIRNKFNQIKKKCTKNLPG